MSVPASHHTDVRDLLFADWGEVVTFREISSTYDPHEGEVTESVSETLLMAIVGPRLNAPQPNTAHQVTTCERSFLFRMEDLPEDASFHSSRIQHGEDEYAILTADLAPATNVIAFTATLILPPTPVSSLH